MRDRGIGNRQSAIGNLSSAALAACAALASCTPIVANNPQDYIGSRATAGSSDRASSTAGQASRGTGPLAAGDPLASPAAPAPPPQPAGPLSLTVSQAILMALGNNRALIVERYRTPIQRTFEQQELAAFDPDLTGQLSYHRARSAAPSLSGQGSRVSQAESAELGATDFLPSGTLLGVTGSTDVTNFANPDEGKYSPHIGLSVTQALLRGFGTNVNLVGLRQARLDTLSTQYELRGFAESLVAQTETTYWDHALAQRQIEIVSESLDLAQRQLSETQERVRLEKLAEAELAAAEAEVALRRQDLINARSTLARTRLQLLRLLSPQGARPLDRELILAEPPVAPDTADIDQLDMHIQTAQRFRPDLNQARLQVRRGDLELVKTKNGLLPKLDLFVSLGKTGYAESFGDSVAHIQEKRNYDALVGLDFEYPLGNRSAEARHSRALLSRDQAREAVGNLAQLVETDVRSAYIEVDRAREQVAATAATRKLQEVKLRTETEKFRVDKSTSFLVAQAQRDLLTSQIGEIQAIMAYRKALVDIYRLEGSLLMRRGIAAPGQWPPTDASSSGP